MRLLAAAAIVLLFSLIATQASATTPTPTPTATPSPTTAPTPTTVPCEGISGPAGNLSLPRVSISPREAGYLVVDWIIALGPYMESTCFVVERRIGDGDFEKVATVTNLGWGDPMYFADAVTVTYRVTAGNQYVHSESGEATTSIPSHTPFVWADSYVRGDVDCNFDVNGLDVTTLLQGLAGVSVSALSDTCYLEPQPGEFFTPWWRWGRTDFDCDAHTDLWDVIVLLRYISGLRLPIHHFCGASWGCVRDSCNVR